MPLIARVVILNLCVALTSSQQTSTSTCVGEQVCCAAGNFSTGDLATITCYFGQDISKIQENFNIVHYPVGSHSGNYVLLCNWLDGRLRCIADGVTFNNVVTDQLTVTITNVSQQSSGNYSCQIVSDDQRPSGKCDLSVQDKKTQTGNKNETATKGTPRYTVTLQPEETRPCVPCEHDYCLGVLIMCCAIFVLNGVQVIFLLWYCRKFLSKIKVGGILQKVSEDDINSHPC